MFISGGSFVYGQKTSSDSSGHFKWVNLGLGVGSLGFEAGGFSAGGGLCDQIGKNIFSFRVLSIEEISSEDYPFRGIGDIGFLYGRIAKASYGFSSISAGISLVGGGRRHNYGDEQFVTVGIPVEAQLFWTPLAFFGIDLYGFANLNIEKSFVGALLCIQFGTLR
jgi:hypothetical protein